MRFWKLILAGILIMFSAQQGLRAQDVGVFIRSHTFVDPRIIPCVSMTHTEQHYSGRTMYHWKNICAHPVYFMYCSLDVNQDAYCNADRLTWNDGSPRHRARAIAPGASSYFTPRPEDRDPQFYCMEPPVFDPASRRPTCAGGQQALRAAPSPSSTAAQPPLSMAGTAIAPSVSPQKTPSVAASSSSLLRSGNPFSAAPSPNSTTQLVARNDPWRDQFGKEDPANENSSRSRSSMCVNRQGQSCITSKLTGPHAIGERGYEYYMYRAEITNRCAAEVVLQIETRKVGGGVQSLAGPPLEGGGTHVAECPAPNQRNAQTFHWGCTGEWRITSRCQMVKK
jgi:hypothetical protein